MKIKCKPKKQPRYQGYVKSDDWKKSKPFFVNPRGILVHRVKSVTSHSHSGEHSHYSVDYWCGNGACFHDTDALVDDPPRDRLLCSFCEFRATAGKQKPSDKLAGRHVHKGVLRAHRVCCGGNDNNN